MTSQLGSTPADGEVVAAARVLLQRMGVDPADLMAEPQQRRPVPTFADYIPVVEAAVSAGTARTYRSYWNRIAAKWGVADPVGAHAQRDRAVPGGDQGRRGGAAQFPWGP